MKIRSLIVFAILSFLTFPVLAYDECCSPVTEIEQPGHFHVIALAPRHDAPPCSGGPPIPRPPIIKEPSAMSILSSEPTGAGKQITAGATESITTGMAPMGSMVSYASQTERVFRLLEGVMKKLK
jgi:hypothetical protein